MMSKTGAAAETEPEKAMRALMERNRDLEAHVATLSAWLEEHRAQDSQVRATLIGRKVPGLVNKFGGKPQDYNAFGTAIQYALELQEGEFASDWEKAAFVIGHLEGCAREWVMPKKPDQVSSGDGHYVLQRGGGECDTKGVPEFPPGIFDHPELLVTLCDASAQVKLGPRF